MKIMKRAAIALVVLSTLAAVPAGSASASAPATKFKNCTAVNKKYPNGVAKSRAAANQQKNRPHVSAKIYRANIKMDRDRDGSICEK
jgi:hypothetical protein